MVNLGAFKDGIVIPITSDSTGLKAGFDEADEELDKTEKKVGSFTGAIEKHGVAIGAAMTAAGGAIIMLTDSAKAMNADLATTGLQLGVTTDDMRDLALETTNVTFPLEEVTSTFDLLTRAGMTNTDTIQETASAFDTLGDATGNSASEVTSAMIPAFNAFNIPLEEAGEHTDTLTHLMRNTTIGMGDFSGAMNYLSADISTLGIDMDTTVAVLEAMADKGIQGSAATREFRTAVTAATADTTDYTQELADLSNEMVDLKDKHDTMSGSLRDNSLSLRSNEINIANAKDALKEMQAEGKKEGETSEQYNRRLETQEIRIESLNNRRDDMIEKQKDLNDGLAENAVAQKANTEEVAKAEEGSNKQSDALETLYTELGVTAEEVEAYKTEIADSTGITQDFADAQNTQYGTMDKLKQGFSEFTLSAGSALEPIEGMGALLATGGPLLVGMSALPGAITMVTGVMGGLNLAFLTSPIFLIAVAIVGIVAVLIILEKKFGIVTKAVDIISGAVSGFIDWITQAVDWSGILGDALDILLTPIDWVQTAISNFGIVWGVVWGAMLDIAKRVSGFIIGIFDAIVGTVKTSINWVIDGINTMIRGLNRLNFDVPDWVPGIGGQSFGFSLNELPHLASGGIVTEPTVAMVGEAGPEAIVPLSESNAGIGGVNITVENMNVRNDQDVKKIATELYTIIDRKNGARGIR